MAMTRLQVAAAWGRRTEVFTLEEPEVLIGPPFWCVIGQHVVPYVTTKWKREKAPVCKDCIFLWGAQHNLPHHAQQAGFGLNEYVKLNALVKCLDWEVKNA